MIQICIFVILHNIIIYVALMIALLLNGQYKFNTISNGKERSYECQFSNICISPENWSPNLYFFISLTY